MNGEMLRKLRKRADCTQQEVADSIGCTRMTLINRESGKGEFKPSEIAQIVGTLGMSFNEMNACFFDGKLNF